MSATAHDLPRRRARPAAAARTRPRRLGALRAAVVLLLVGGFLTAIVALNVAALRANMRAGAIQGDTRKVVIRNGQLQAELAELRSGDRIAKAAQRLDMVLPREQVVKTLQLPPHGG